MSQELFKHQLAQFMSLPLCQVAFWHCGCSSVGKLLSSSLMTFGASSWCVLCPLHRLQQHDPNNWQQQKTGSSRQTSSCAKTGPRPARTVYLTLSQNSQVVTRAKSIHRERYGVTFVFITCHLALRFKGLLKCMETQSISLNDQRRDLELDIPRAAWDGIWVS